MATRWASDEERGLDMMRTRWWWQPGPVASCCGCFTIRTGVCLLLVVTPVLLYSIFSANILQQQCPPVPALLGCGGIPFG